MIAALLVCVVSLGRLASITVLLGGEVWGAMEHVCVRHISPTCGEQARFSGVRDALVETAERAGEEQSVLWVEGGACEKASHE